MMYALFAIGINASAALLCHHCDGDHVEVHPGVDAWAFAIKGASTPTPDELNIDKAPKEPGLYVWAGTMHVAYNYEAGCVEYVDLYGSWDKATPGEIMRFMLGRPAADVFAGRIV